MNYQAFVDRINVKSPINVICLQECWLKHTDNVTMFNLTGYLHKRFTPC